MSGHTKGPWIIGPSVMRYMSHTVTAPMGKTGQLVSIAHVDDVDGYTGSTKANARLIAAAPEMLEMLLEAVEAERHNEGTDKEPVWYEGASAAISKAQGGE